MDKWPDGSYMIPPGEYIEAEDSGGLEESVDGPSRGTRTLICNWEDRVLVRPLRFSAMYPEIPYMLCVSVRIDPYGGIDPATGWNRYAKIVAQYSSRKPIERAVQHFSMRSQALETGTDNTWASDGTPCNQTIVKYFNATEHSLTMWVLSTWDAPFYINDYYPWMNKVNSGVFLGANAGTLLFEGMEADEEHDLGGAMWFRVTFNFLHRTEGHNSFWRSDTGDWDTLTHPLFASADFSGLGVAV